MVSLSVALVERPYGEKLVLIMPPSWISSRIGIVMYAIWLGWWQILPGAATPPSVAITSGHLSSTTVLSEWSGLAASRTMPGSWWAHNDSGNPAELVVLSADLQVMARLPVAADHIDWEDLAWADGRLFIADTGDNRRRRSHVQVHVVVEPSTVSPAVAPLPVERTYRLTYPDGARDVEALVVCDRWLWLIDKRLSGAQAWRADRQGPDEQILTAAAVPGLPGTVLAADLHPSGSQLAIAHPLGVTLLALTAGDLSTVDLSLTQTISLPLAIQREAVAYTLDGRSIFSGSESGAWWRITGLLP